MKLLLLDWDGTLFEPRLFGQRLSATLKQEYDIEKGVIQKAFQEYKKQIKEAIEFDPSDYLAVLSSISQVDKIKLEKLFWRDEFLYKNALYDETKPFLDKAAKKYELGIFSEGVVKFQTNKIEKSGMGHYFAEENRYIFPKKTTQEAVDTLPKDCIIVDNKQDIVNKMKGYGFDCRWINRPEMNLFSLDLI